MVKPFHNVVEAYASDYANNLQIQGTYRHSLRIEQHTVHPGCAVMNKIWEKKMTTNRVIKVEV